MWCAETFIFLHHTQHTVNLAKGIETRSLITLISRGSKSFPTEPFFVQPYSKRQLGVQSIHITNICTTTLGAKIEKAKNNLTTNVSYVSTQSAVVCLKYT